MMSDMMIYMMKSCLLTRHFSLVESHVPDNDATFCQRKTLTACVNFQYKKCSFAERAVVSLLLV